MRSRDIKLNAPLHLACLGITVALCGCTSLNSIPSDEYLVKAPVSDRANVVLSNLMTDCPIVNGRWKNDKSCTGIQSAAFGYGVGKRRNRKDIIRIGRVSAKNESKKIQRLAYDYIFKRQKNLDLDRASGFASMFLSGTYDHDSLDYFLYSKCMDAFTSSFDTNENYLVDTFVAYFLSLQYRAEKHAQETYLEKARLYADSVLKRGHPAFAAFAYCGIAQASDDPHDLKIAKTLVTDSLPKYFDMEDGSLQVVPSVECLSQHEAMIHALSDLEQMEPEGPWREYALTLLDYIFSDTYFDGKFIVHHLNQDGSQADYFCAGCNFTALILADRLYGDTFIIDPVEPPKQIKIKLKILQADYGIDDSWIDVEPQIKKVVARNKLALLVSNKIAGDPAPGKPKVLRVTYRYGKDEEFKQIPEGWTLRLP